METTVEVCPAVIPPPDPALVNKAFMEKYVRQVKKWIRRDLAPLIKENIGTDNGEGISTYADGSNHEYIRTTLFVNTADCCHHITVYRYDDGSSDMHLLTRVEATMRNGSVPLTASAQAHGEACSGTFWNLN